MPQRLGPRIMEATLASERPARYRCAASACRSVGTSYSLRLRRSAARSIWRRSTCCFASRGLRAGEIWWLWHGHVGIQLSLNEGALFGFGQGRVWLFATLERLGGHRDSRVAVCVSRRPRSVADVRPRLRDGGRARQPVRSAGAARRDWPAAAAQGKRSTRCATGFCGK